MRAARFHLFTSMDGRTFVPALQSAIEPEEVYPGANGLFDPTRSRIARRPNRRVFDGSQRSDERHQPRRKDADHSGPV
jgi:hypothetical protein